MEKNKNKTTEGNGEGEGGGVEDKAQLQRSNASHVMLLRGKNLMQRGNGAGTSLTLTSFTSALER